MGQQSQSGQVGFKTQAQKGTFAAPATDGIFMRILSGALGGNRELLTPDPEIGGGRDVPDAYLGALAYSGEYEFYPRMNSLLTLLNAALGSTVSAASGDVTEHVITPIDVGSLPWLSVEEAIAGDYEVFNYTDAKVNSIHLEADANGYLRGTVGLIALTQQAGRTRTVTPEWDITPLLVGTNIVVTYDGLALPAKSFSFDITNNLEDDDFRLGSVTLGDAVEKRREITAGVNIRPEDSDLYRQAMYGSAASDVPLAGAAVKGELAIAMQSYEVIGTSSEPYSLELEMPEASIRPFALNPSGDDVVEHDLEIQALRPDPGVPIVTATIRNDLSAVA